MKRFYFLFLPILILFWIDSINAQESLTLSLDEAVFQAIENNLGLKVERYTPFIISQDILIEKGAFDPSLSLEGSKSYQDALSPSVVENIMQRSVDVSFAFSGKVETGTKYKFAWDYQRVKGDSPYLRLNPYYFTGFTFAASQPLLKGFGKKIQTTNIKVAEENLKISEYDFISKAEELSNGTVKIFFEVLFTKESFEIARFSLSFAEKILSDVKAKVKAGYMASVDLYNAEAEVAKREEFVLKAENTYKDSLDSLRRVLGLEDWDKDIILVKPETPSNELPDLTDSIQNAQLYRKDLQQSLIEVEKKKLITRFYKNQKLPDLELSVAAGLTGLSDTSSEAFDRIGISNDKNWKVGLFLKIPLFWKEARGRYLKAKYEESQAEELVRELRQRITLEVRNAWRDLSLSLKKIEASKKTRIASEKRMEAEERRFQSGIATLTDVLEFQEEYIKSLLNEKGADFYYHISLSEYEKVKGTLLIKFGISDSELGITKDTNNHKSSKDSRYVIRNSQNPSMTGAKTRWSSSKEYSFSQAR
jgi:outer membrane protein TolC